MSTPVIALARDALSRALTALTAPGGPLHGWQVLNHMPDQITPPCLIVSESTPLATTAQDGALGQITVAFEVAIIPRTAGNTDGLPALDTATDATLTHLWEEGMDVTVDSYNVLTAPDSRLHIASRLTTRLTVTLT